MQKSTSISISKDGKQAFDWYYRGLVSPKPTRAELLGFIVKNWLDIMQEQEPEKNADYFEGLKIEREIDRRHGS